MTPEALFAMPHLGRQFGFTDEHALAREAARRFLEEASSARVIRRLADDPAGFDRAAWKRVAELGWIGLVLPEAHGGLGLDHLQLALLLDEMGRVLFPSPYFACLLALFALDRAGSEGQKLRWCKAIASGELIATVALHEPGASWDPGDVKATAEKTDGGFVLRGEKSQVLFGASAGMAVVPCREAGGALGLFLVELPAKGAAIDNEVCVDTTRRTAHLTLDGVRVGAEARLEGDAMAALTALHVRGRALLAAEITGALETVLELTRRYAIERKQFGRQIGSFQAVKHPIVDMMVGVELARSLSYGAAASLDHDPARADIFGRMAKSFSSDALSLAAKKAVQLHGGFGFTWDCDVHFYFKRALWSRPTLGDGVHHRRHLAAALLDRS